MKKIATWFIINLLCLSKVIGATANCSGGECNFDNSFHYKSAKTYCTQTLVYEKVETDFLYFTIIKNGKRCDVFETRKEN